MPTTEQKAGEPLYPPTLRQLLMYEIYTSRWAGFIGIDWMNKLVFKYYLWKTRRKWCRFLDMYVRVERQRHKGIE